MAERPVLKLYYFDLPGRAEAIRLTLHVGEIEFEDIRFSREEWPEIKPKTPFGLCPAMEVDGTWVGETYALVQYAAALAGLVPVDPLQHALAQQAMYVMEDAWQALAPTMAPSLPQEERVAQQKEQMLHGKCSDKMGQLSKLLEGKQYLLPGGLCYVDLELFTALSMLRSGWLEGIPRNFLDAYPPLKAHRDRVAALPRVKEYYADKAGQYLAFQPDE